MSSSQNISYAGQGEAETWNADRKHQAGQGQRGKREQKTFTSWPAGVLVASTALARLN